MTRRSHYGWMTLGALLCLFGIALACKLRDGNRAHAQAETLPPPSIASEQPEATPSKEPRPLPALPSVSTVPGPVSDLEPAIATLPVSPAPSANAGQVDDAAPLPPVGSDPRPILIPASATIPAPGTAAAPIPPSAPPAPPSVSPAPAATIPSPVQTTAPVVIPPSSPTPLPPPAVTPPAEGQKLPPIGTGIPDTKVPPIPPVSTPPPPPPSNTTSMPPSDPHLKQTEVRIKYETPPTPGKVEAVKDHGGEPPLAPTPGPVVQYRVHTVGETFKSLARKTLGSIERWGDIHKLNPTIRPDTLISIGTVVRLPGDACVQEDSETVRPLPPVRHRMPTKPRVVLPLTGTFPLTLDDRKILTLPPSIVQQLGNCDTVLLSPGSDRCLWLTNQAHLDRLQAKLDKSPARESDVRGFKRLYYAQVVKVSVKDGRVVITDKLANFAGLGTEVVLVGIDDHFEVWDAARWRRYTQVKKATTTASVVSE